MGDRTRSVKPVRGNLSHADCLRTYGVNSPFKLC